MICQWQKCSITLKGLRISSGGTKTATFRYRFHFTGLAVCTETFAVWAQKRIRHLRSAKEEQCSEKVHLPYDASEEELLSYDLADEDFSLCEEEEEEWRQYDEEVTQFKKLVLECGSDPMSSSSRSAFAKCGLTQTHDSPDADLRGLFDGPCHEVHCDLASPIH
eukprot:symbB.v1.2.031826.t1/scaffold3738.1/size51178/3